jgi:hypothetical protein
VALVLIVGGAWFAAAAHAQTPTAPPEKGYSLHEERAVDRFVVRQWLNDASPDVSPAGFCECITVVFDGDRQVLRLGPDVGIITVTSTGDVDGDRRAELMVTTNSGGAHCCQSTAIYSVTAATPRPLLSIDTGDCQGELVDLDKDGTAEFQACDAMFGYEFCSFAFSPFPPVVFAYDRQKAEFALATPRYARYLQLPSVTEARETMAKYSSEPEISRCAALGPALGLIYTGRVAEGQALFRSLYRQPDAVAVEQRALEMARSSQLWIAE